MAHGDVRWLGGLRGDTAGGISVEDAFVVADRDLEPGERVVIGSEGRSSESFIPLLFVNADRDEFFGGVMWSGAWHAAIERPAGIDDRLSIVITFPAVATTVTSAQPLEISHT